jgi:hypothetical protein
VLGKDVGPVIELLENPADFLFRFGMDPAPVVQNPVNRADRDPGLPGYVFNGNDCWSSLKAKISS